MTVLPFPASPPVEPGYTPGGPTLATGPTMGNLAIDPALMDLLPPQEFAMPAPPELPPPAHDENLAEILPEAVLAKLATDYLQQAEDWAEGQKAADELLARGLEEMGLDRTADVRNVPFEGASAVVHPLLAQAGVEYQSRAIRELLPPNGPCKTRVMGAPDPMKDDKARRVREYMNYQITVEMGEYRDEMEKLLLMNGLCGSQFKKVWWDGRLKRPRSAWILSENLVTPYNASSLSESPYAERLTPTAHQFRMNVLTGLWRDVGTVPGDAPAVSSTQAVADRVTGSTPDAVNQSGTRQVWEVYADIDLSQYAEPGQAVDMLDAVPLPYILTIDKTTGKALSLRRNWREQDPLMLKRVWHIHYPCIPWRGFRTIGLLHLIGGLARAATGALRALMDSALLNTIPAGIRLKGAGVHNTQSKVLIEPMSFTEIEGAAGATDIRTVAMPLPFNPPSSVLFQLLGMLVDSGQRFASVVNMPLEGPQNMPVGTMLAHIEQGSMVYSAIHSRLQGAQGKELRLLHELNYENLDDAVTARTFGGELVVSYLDFDDEVDVIPAADPNIFSHVQRAAKAEAQKALAVEANGMGVPVDLRTVFRDVAVAQEFPNAEEMFPEPPQAQPMDPVSEIMALQKGLPVAAFPGQDHEAHVRFLLATAQDPRYAPLIPTIGPQLQALANEHLTMLMRDDVERRTGLPLPPPGQPLPPEVAQQIAQASAQVAEQLSAERQQQAQAGQPDPMGAGFDALAQVQAMDVQRKAKADQDKIGIEMEKIRSAERRDAAKLIADTTVDREQIASRERIEGAKLNQAFLAKLGQVRSGPIPGARGAFG